MPNTNAFTNLSPKKRLHVDMDGVLCNIVKGYMWAKARHPGVKYPQSIPGLFENLVPIEGAVEAINRLREDFDLWILSAPSVRNPNCYKEKRIWIEKYFDYSLAKRLILCTNKGLVKGHYLIDDNLDGKGQETFEGELIHFGSSKYPNWESVLKYFYTTET